MATIKLPAKLCKDRAAVAIDIGGSLLKCIYYDKSGINNNTDPDTVEAQLRTFPTADVDTALGEIRDVMDKIDFDWASYVMMATGYGSVKHKNNIIEKLKIKDLKLIGEFEACVKSLNALRENMAEVDYIEEKPKDAVQRAVNGVKVMMKFVNKSASESGDKKTLNSSNDTKAEVSDDKKSEEDASKKSVKSDAVVNGEEKDCVNNSADDNCDNNKKAKQLEYPYLLVTLGSGTTALKVEEDGSHKMIMALSDGGKSFTALASLITGVKNFEEIVAMLKKGDVRNVDSIGKDFKTDSRGTEAETWYSSIPADATVYNLGKAVWRSPDDFKKEDILASLLSITSTHHAQAIIDTAINAKIKHIYVTGSFIQPQPIKFEMTWRIMFQSLVKSRMFKTYFKLVQNSSHLSALGCLLTNNCA